MLGLVQMLRSGERRQRRAGSCFQPPVALPAAAISSQNARPFLRIELHRNRSQWDVIRLDSISTILFIVIISWKQAGSARLLGPAAANFENDYKRKEKVYERNERLKIPSWREDDGHLCW